MRTWRIERSEEGQPTKSIEMIVGFQPPGDTSYIMTDGFGEDVEPLLTELGKDVFLVLRAAIDRVGRRPAKFPENWEPTLEEKAEQLRIWQIEPRGELRAALENAGLWPPK